MFATKYNKVFYRFGLACFHFLCPGKESDCLSRVRVEGPRQCSELPTMSKQTMRTDHAGLWSSRSTEGVEIHGPSADGLRSVLVCLMDSYMTNNWSSSKD